MLVFARRVKHLGEQTEIEPVPISIFTYTKDEAGRLQARAAQFVCEDCDKPVVPVIYDEVKDIRRHSASCHFRLKRAKRGEPAADHERRCPHFVERVFTDGSTDGSISGVPARTKAPSVFVDRDPAGVRAVHEVPIDAAPANAGGSTGGGRRRSAPQDRVATTRVYHLSGLAGAFHADAAGVDGERLGIADCPGAR